MRVPLIGSASCSERMAHGTCEVLKPRDEDDEGYCEGIDAGRKRSLAAMTPKGSLIEQAVHKHQRLGMDLIPSGIITSCWTRVGGCVALVTAFEEAERRRSTQHLSYGRADSRIDQGRKGTWVDDETTPPVLSPTRQDSAARVGDALMPHARGVAVGA